jgi:predicted nucleic acid-binding protein
VTCFLRDRDVLSAAENPEGNRPEGNRNVHAWIEGVSDNDLYIFSVTVMEARKGFARLRAKAGTDAEAEEILGYEADFNNLLGIYDNRIVPIDRVVAERWGEMLGRRDANVLDTAVAATAAVHGFVAATRNLRHFRGRGVRLLDPFKVNPTIEESKKR